MPKIRLFFLVLTFLFFLFLSPKKVHAEFSCSASIAPTSVSTGGGTVTLTVTNTGDTKMEKVGIDVPSSGNYTMSSSSSESWSQSAFSPSNTEFFGDAKYQDESVDISIDVITALTSGGAETWRVQGMEDYSAGGFVDCSPMPSLSVAQTLAVSGLTVSGITNERAVISWTTNWAANSYVYYGTTQAYGTTANEDSYTTSHSITISGLSAGTTYSYKVKSTDASGNSVESSNNTITTAATAGTAGTSTTTTTTTVSTSATVAGDTTSPKVSFTESYSGVYDVAPSIKGTSTDGSGIADIEYSVDGGKNWLPVEFTGRLGGKTLGFSFSPEISEDGNFEIYVRSTDLYGNKGLSKKISLVIDRLPPAIGASIFYFGPQILKSDKEGIYKTGIGVQNRVALSAVGGPTSINIYAGSQTFSLSRNPDNGIWYGNIILDKEGLFELKTKSIDGAENVTEGSLGKVRVLAEGEIKSVESFENAKILIYSQHPFLKTFVPWNGNEYGIETPINTKGKYSLMLPKGRYYLLVSTPGYKKAISNIVTLTEPTYINVPINIEKSGNGFWGAILSLFGYSKFEITSSTENKMVFADIDGELPTTTLWDNGEEILTSKYLGEKYLMVITSSWHPQLNDEISALEKIEKIPVKLVLSQDGSTKARLLKERGGYSINILADPDGTLQKELELINLPVNLVIDQKGTIQKAQYGVLTVSEIEALIRE